MVIVDCRADDTQQNRLGYGGDGVREESTCVVKDMVRFVLKSWVHSSFYFGLDVHAVQEQEGKPEEN